MAGVRSGAQWLDNRVWAGFPSKMSGSCRYKLDRYAANQPDLINERELSEPRKLIDWLATTPDVDATG